MIPSHHKVIDVDRVKRAESNVVVFTIACIPLPILQTKIILGIAWVVKTEGSSILHNSVIGLCMIADIVPSKDMVTLVSSEFSLCRNVGSPVELKTSILDWLKSK